MRILITGGTGFIGRPLVRRLLKAGHRVRVLSRDAGTAELMLPKEAETYTWDGRSPVPPSALAGVDAVAHCSGENVGRWPWNEERKRGIRDSRVETTRNLVQSLAQLDAARRPAVLVSASAVGFYGDGGDAWLREGDGPGKGFLASVVKEWEDEIFKVQALGIRAVAMRLGVVLGDGGALDNLQIPFKLGLGAVLGSGRQYMSWIHRTDVAEAIIFALGNAAVNGPLNVSAPEPASNRDFSRALARVLGRPLLLRVPGWALSAVLGEMARETLLTSQRASSERLAGLGYRFRYPGLESALSDIIMHARKRK